MTRSRAVGGVRREVWVWSIGLWLVALGPVALLGGCATSTTGCPEPLAECAGFCVDTASDAANCGGCGIACDAGEVCDGSGACAVSCQRGFALCGGTCIDPMTSQTFCGASGDCEGGNAGAACAPGEVCAGGSCATECQAGFVLCDGVCIDPMISNAFCGADRDCNGGFAGVACAPGQICSAGVCDLTCQPGQVACGGVCTDPTISNVFCGATGDCLEDNAGVACGAGTICSGGECAANCQAGFLDCDGRCVDPLTDNVFCGASADCAGENVGVACEAGTICSGGECATNCQAGFIECGGRCVDPMSNNAFCGASADCAGDNVGVVCPSGTICGDGVCAVTCPSILVACGGTCVDPRSNPTFCGARGDCLEDNAGVTCAGGEVCSGRECEVSCQEELLACSGRCIDPDSSRSFCGASGSCTGGAAGVICGSGEDCIDGECLPFPCPTGLVGCGSFCVDPDSDPVFCGASGDCLGANAGETCGRRAACIDAACTGVGESGYVFALFDVDDRGFWTAAGNHTAGNRTVSVGRESTGAQNGYLTFDLSGITGRAVLSARLRFEVATYRSADLTETLAVWDVDTAVATVIGSATGNTEVFDDLGGGGRYALQEIESTEVGSILEIELRGPVYGDLVDAFGGDFVVGLSLPSASSDDRIQGAQGAESRVLQLAIEYLP